MEKNTAYEALYLRFWILYSLYELIFLFYFFSQEISLTEESIYVTLQTWNNIDFRIVIYIIFNNYFNFF